MLRTHGVRKVIALAVSFLLPVSYLAPAIAAPAGSAVRAGAVYGKVIGSAGQPVSGATVIAHGLDSGEERASAPTREDGSYEMTGLAEGRYRIAVSTSGGIYLGAREIRVGPQEMQAYSFRLRSASDEEIGQHLLAASEDQGGGEEPEEKKKRRRGALTGWVNPATATLAGVALIVGIAALIDAADDDDDDEDEDEDESPSLP